MLSRSPFMRLCLATTLLLVACEVAPTGPGEEGARVEVTADITTNTVWSPTHVYVIRKWDLRVSAVLTLEPGVIVKFTAEGPELTLDSGGRILADGTPEEPIVFTSIRDRLDLDDFNLLDWSNILYRTPGAIHRIRP